MSSTTRFLFETFLACAVFPALFVFGASTVRAGLFGLGWVADGSAPADDEAESGREMRRARGV